MLRFFAQWLGEKYSGYATDVTVSSSRRQPEEKLIADHPRLQLSPPTRSYARYGYTVSDFYAQTFAQQIGANALGFRARLTNCGMAAINTVLKAANLSSSSDWVMRGEVLYPETHKLLDGELCSITVVDSGDLERIVEFCQGESVPTLQFYETLGNGSFMPVLDVDGLFRHFWNKQTIVVLDNTLLSPVCLDVFGVWGDIRRELGDPTMRLVYVESLSKHYRVDAADSVTAGIIIAPQEFIAACDQVIMRTGAYLQYRCLAMLPWKPLDAVERIMEGLSVKSNVAATFLRQHKRVLSVSYPFQLGSRAGGVLFFTYNSSSTDEIVKRMESAFGSYMGSFGHANTTWVPWRKAYPECHPCLIRLAVGFNETGQDLLDKLSLALAD